MFVCINEDKIREGREFVLGQVGAGLFVSAWSSHDLDPHGFGYRDNEARFAFLQAQDIRTRNSIL